MLACRQGELIRHSELELAVKLHVVFTLSCNLDLLRLGKVELLAELHSHKMAVGFPERGKECSPLGTVVVHPVAEPYLIVARIPYPGLS